MRSAVHERMPKRSDLLGRALSLVNPRNLEAD